MKRILSLVLKLSLSGILLYIFFSQVDIQSVIKTVKQTDLLLFVLGFFLYLSTVFISARRWSLFLPQSLRYSKLLSLYFIGSFFNTFLPGLVGGDAIKAFYLYRYTGEGTGGTSLASVFMDRYIGFTAMMGIGFVAFITGYTYITGTEIIWVIPILCGGFLLGSLILWRINWGKIKTLNSFYIPLMGYKAKKKIICRGLLLGFSVHFIGIICVYILSLSIGLKVPVIYFFIFIPIISAASAIPVSLAGLGIREAGFVILFGSAGVSAEEALSLSLLMFAIMCAVNMLGGIEYLRVGKPSRGSLEFRV